MREQQPPRTRGLVGGHRLVDGQMAARGAVRVAARQRRLAHEQVDVTCQHREALAGAAVAGVRERHIVGLDPEPVRLERVVRQPDRGQLEPHDLDRLFGGVLAHVEDALEHVGEAELQAERDQPLAPAGLHEQLGPDVAVAVRRVLPEHRAPHPRDEVAPVVEMEVRDRDRVHVRPRLTLAQPGEDTGPAVEQKPPPPCLHEVARVGAAGVRPGRRRADDRQPHAHILPRWKDGDVL